MTVNFPRNKSIAYVTLLVLLPLTGCGTLMGGGTQMVQVNSAPSGATVTLAPDAGSFTTPASLSLERKYSYTITASREGYSPATARINKSMRTSVLLADLFFFPIGVIVDAITGAWYQLSPQTVSLVLERGDESVLAAGPDVIEVTVSVDEQKDGLAEIHATSPVQIEVTRD